MTQNAHEIAKREARILWLEKRLNEREDTISILLDELCKLKGEKKDESARLHREQ